MREFQTATRRERVIEFMVDADVFHFNPPKRIALVLDSIGLRDGSDPDNVDPRLAPVKSMFDWLGQGLPQEESDRLIERMRDPEDDLDIDDVAEIVKWLMEQVAGRPTSSSSG